MEGNEVLEQEQNNAQPKDQVEKESYSAYSYKEVRKIRQKGAMRGIEVPYLKYPVTQPEKPRVLFLILGIISAILFAAAVVGAGYVFITTVLPLILNTIGVTGALTTKHTFDILGLGVLFGGLVSIMVWMLPILIIGVLIALIVTLFILTRQMFGMTKLSMQEFAVGHEISNLIRNLIIIISIPAIVAVAVFITVKNIQPAGIALLIGVIAVFALVFGSILAYLIIGRRKAKKQFAELSEEQQADFKAHARALEKAHRRRGTKSIHSKLSNLDF